jgi:FdrA protein
MNVHTKCLILPSLYRDSVVLMQISHALQSQPGVQQAGVMMGAVQNLQLLREAGLLAPQAEQAGPNDLIICVQADDPATAEAALQHAKALSTQTSRQPEEAAETAPRTLATALRRMPDANLACISVPGQYAHREAMRALQSGLHVFLFSDQVDLESEQELKQVAAQQGLLVMGPDCGTAILRGAPLGFANQLKKGPVGLLSASGTGLQQVACLLAQQGIGVSHAIGVGGRDLHHQLGAPSMRAALQALAQDPHTQVIVLISKPPDASVAHCLAKEAKATGKPCVLALIGWAEPFAPTDKLYCVSTLEAAALTAARLASGAAPWSMQALPPEHLQTQIAAAQANLRAEQHSLVGLYCGGTLAAEALWLLRQAGLSVYSNLDDTYQAGNSPQHVIVDLGADMFTRGRPHPMIDPQVRTQQLLALLAKPRVAVVLCDVMLGWGSHAAPGVALASAWQTFMQQLSKQQRQVIGIATLCGTADDPQNMADQCQALQAQGFLIADSNAQAVRLAAAILGIPLQTTDTTDVIATDNVASRTPPLDNATPAMPAHLPALLADGPKVINLGLEQFATQLKTCGVPVLHVDWRPPAAGDRRLTAMLERLR